MFLFTYETKKKKKNAGKYYLKTLICFKIVDNKATLLHKNSSAETKLIWMFST